jgi:hypothetical protein
MALQMHEENNIKRLFISYVFHSVTPRNGDILQDVLFAELVTKFLPFRNLKNFCNP